MGYTRYWENTDTKYDDTTIDVVKAIITIAEKDYNIIIKGPDGTGDPVINHKSIGLNGDRSHNLDCESFIIPNGTDFGFDFCKTARQPYDIVVNAVIQLMKKKNVITKCSSDGDNQEKEATNLLSKAIKEATTMYVLEAYDKDNDVYKTLAENKQIQPLKTVVNILISGTEPRMENGEPVDWFLITNKRTETPLWYFDMYEKEWKKYKKPPKPAISNEKEET